MRKGVFVLVFISGVLVTLIAQRIDYNQFLPWSMQPVVEESVEPGQEKEMTLSYSETSPDQENDIILYKRLFTGKSSLDYQNYLSNQHFFAVRNSESRRERDIYVENEKVGNPHWLGDDFIFFTTGCGTDCQGLRLLDIRDKRTWLGVLSYMFDRGFRETVFQDWFKRKFQFPGLVQQIKAETINNKSYLIFQMIDDKKASLGDKRFLFTDEKLMEQ